MKNSKLRAWDEQNKVMHHDFQFIKSGNDGNDWIVFSSDKQKLTMGYLKDVVRLLIFVCQLLILVG